MSELDLSGIVDLARNQLASLRVRLEDQEAGPASPEIKRTLGELVEVLERLGAHYALLREILARTSDAVFAKRPDGRYLMINRTGAAMFGKSVADILGRDDTALFAPESAERIMAIDRTVMTTGKPHTFEGTFHIQSVPITLLTTVTAWYDPRGTRQGLIGSSQDVTKRRRMERGAKEQQDRLSSLASAIVKTEEGLRQSLAAELHNGLGQDLALTKMKLAALRSASKDDLHDSLTPIERLVEQADRSLRSITFRLSPPSLHDLGLVPALQGLAEDIGTRYGLAVRIEDQGAPPVADGRLRVILFRAARELLINAATHARASEAVLSIGSQDGLLRISVEDEGAGFDPAEAELRGYGLFGIREQLRPVGGSLQVESTPGRGTTVTLSAPLTSEITAEV